MGRNSTPSKLRGRVVAAAEAAVADHGYASVLDILCGVGWLAPVNIDRWKIGRVATVAELIPVSADRVAEVAGILRAVAEEKALIPTETQYARGGRDGLVRLTFGYDRELDAICHMHFVSSALPEKKRQKIQEKLEAPPKLAVFQAGSDRECSECGVPIERDEFVLADGSASLCLACGRLDDLEFLPAGDVALTRRSTKFSARVAVVLRFNRSRKRYERQGILAEPAAIEKAEASCLEDAPQRAEARARGAERRREEDRILVTRMIGEISKAFPKCPPAEVEEIARHTATRGSGRVGRSAAGRELKPDALKLAVIASIRHRHTNYDELLARGVDRAEARLMIAETIEAKLESWRG